MSSYFDEASLVMIPSGYKDQKVYSVKPLDGSGDLTFSRASSATRVASNGLIEKVRTNLALYSEQFDNAAYTKYSATITANTTETTDPLGGNVADIFVSANATTGCGMETNITYVSGGEYTVSIYAKYKNTPFLQMLAPSFVTTEYVNFNVQTGVIAGGSYARTPTITSVGNGWYRCSFTFVSLYTGTTAIGVTQLVDSASSTRGQAFTGDGVKGVYLFGAQAETGVMTDYIATTSAAVSVGPVSGLPRLDYLNSTCPRLLLEPQRTNLCLWSEQFDNATWTKTRATFTANQTTAPDGYTSADLYTDGTFTGNVSFVEQAVTVGSAGTTYSIFVKKGTADYVSFGFYDTAFHGFVVNTNTWASTYTFGSASSFTATNYGNGWYRLSMYKAAASNVIYLSVAVQANSTGANYNGTGALTAYFWGAQVEASGATYATSYIPTLGTSVTRVADAASKTGISSLIGQTEGTLFLDFVFSRATESFAYFAIQNASATSRVRITYTASSNTMRLDLIIGGSASVLNTFNPVDGTRYKMAIAYKSGDSVAYRNGVQVGTQAATFTYTDLSILTYDNPAAAGTQVISGRHNQALLFKTRLTNAQLAELTTL